VATQNAGLPEARILRRLQLVSERLTLEKVICREDHLRASWKLAFETPVFDGSKISVCGMAGDAKCEPPGGSCLTKAVTAGWETATCIYNMS
jgi:hypothetical protein